MNLTGESVETIYQLGKNKGRTQGILIGMASVLFGNIIAILILQLI